MIYQEEPQIDLVQQAIDDVTAPAQPDFNECSAVSYTPPRPIVQTIAHLQQHADGTLADILATLRRMAEETVQQLEDENATYYRWLENAEKQLHRIIPQREALVYERESEREKVKAQYEHACHTISRMHEAATGVTGAAPIRGLVEDVQDLRNEWTRLLNERTAITSRLGVEGTEHSFVLDHIDYLKREAVGYARLQDIADGYRAALLKIADAAEHDNFPEGLDWHGRKAWIREIIGTATEAQP